LCGTSIRKTYDSADRFVKIKKLRSVYHILSEKGVPNVDSLSLTHADREHGAVAYLAPRGVNNSPRDTGEVLDAVACVLEALVVRMVHSADYEIS
jgi:hypothetical protein